MSTDPAAEASLAVVAGASGTIGRAVAQRLTEAGWQVIGTYRESTPGPSVGELVWVPYDGSAASARQLADALDGRPAPVRAVISCIGAPSSKRRVADTDAGEYEALFAGNVASVVRLWQAVCARARQAQAGVVLLSSDTTASFGAGNGAYSAAKAGLEALGITLAAEEAEHGVRVNLVSPSLVASPLAEHVLSLKGVTSPDRYYQELPWGRALTADEVAAVAVDLATAPHWRYVSGQVVRVAARR